MPLSGDETLIDLRPAEVRFARPLERHFGGPVRALTLDRIERGEHGLARGVAYVVVCDHGWRSGLAARLLVAEGLDARAYPGGAPALFREWQVTRTG